MYISCADDAVAVEAEMGYVPNNPLFGLPLESPQVKNSKIIFSRPFDRTHIKPQSSLNHCRSDQAYKRLKKYYISFRTSAG